MEVTKSVISKSDWFKKGHYLGIKYKHERRKQLKRIFKLCIFSVPYMALLMSLLERMRVQDKILSFVFLGTYVAFILVMLVLFIQQLLHQFVEVEVLEGYINVIDNQISLGDKAISGIPRKARDIINTAWSCVLYANSQEFQGVYVFKRIDCYLPIKRWQDLETSYGDYNLYAKVYRVKGKKARFLSMDLFVDRGDKSLVQVFPNKYTKN